MAERATADRVAADMKPPNYRGAVQRLRTIKAKKERVAGINGEISGIYDTVEGYKVNKKAAKMFMALDPLEPDEQQDIWRSLLGLIDAAEWTKGDLVDQAEGGNGNIVAADFGGRRKASTAESDQDLDEALADVAKADEGDGEDALDEEEQPKTTKPKGGRLSPAEARKRAQEHFGEGKAPPASSVPAAEPYTGDNSDLADE